MLQLKFHPHADKELLEAKEWYEQQSVGAAEHFAEEIEQGLGIIWLFPEAWPIRVGPFRRDILKRFPYALIYRHKSHQIEILPVAHLHRKPEYWMEGL